MSGPPSNPWSFPDPTRSVPRPPSLPRLPFRVIAAAALVLAVLIALAGSFYTVQPTEMAGVRRFGTVLTPVPVQPGLHFKLPLVDEVDKIQTSLTALRMDNMTVYTVDNQSVGIGVGLTYRVPEDAVLQLLYRTGRTGSLDINTTMQPIIADRVMRVFSTQNTVNISIDRAQIAIAVRREVSQALRSIFGIEVTDLQISSISYSPTFEQSVEQAVQAKNDAIRAQNTVARFHFEGEQIKVQADAQAAVRIAQANGEAQANIDRARGERQAAILRAEGDSQATLLNGQAQAKVLQLVGSVTQANPSVLGYQAATRWNGALPATSFGAGANPMTLFSLPAAQH